MRKEKLLNGLTILGILCCIELGIVYYQANYNPYASPSFCNINEFVDCDAVAQTSKAVFAGIPLTYWGMFLYLFILMLLHVDKLKKIKWLWFLKVFKNPMSYISVLGIVSFLISVCLAVISIFQINKICIMCFVTYFINLAIGLIATDFKNGGFIKSFKDSCVDFVSGVKECTKPFIIAVVIIGLFLTWAYAEMPFASRKQSIKHYMLMKHNPYKVSGNVLGNPNGKIKVEFFSDYECPVCYSYNIMLHKIAKNNKEVLIEHYNLPLDKKINHYLEKDYHKRAGQLAIYAVAAENQGKYWDMADRLYENPPENDGEAEEIAKKLGMNTDKFREDIKSEKTRQKVINDISYAVDKGVDGTPSIIVNGEIYHGAKAYFELERIILGK